MTKSKEGKRELIEIVAREPSNASQLSKNFVESVRPVVNNPEIIRKLQRAAKERPGVVNEITMSAYSHARRLGFEGDDKERWVAEYVCNRYYAGAGNQ